MSVELFFVVTRSWQESVLSDMIFEYSTFDDIPGNVKRISKDDPIWGALKVSDTRNIGKWRYQ